MIEFRLDRSSGTPTYLQLVQQVRHALRTGVLVAGDQLPTAADVVAQLAVNPNTVLKAYRELDREGLVSARPGLGTFIRRGLGAAAGAASDTDRARLRRQLAYWVHLAHDAGLDDEDIEALVAATLHDAKQTRGCP